MQRKEINLTDSSLNTNSTSTVTADFASTTGSNDLNLKSSELKSAKKPSRFSMLKESVKLKWKSLKKWQKFLIILGLLLLIVTPVLFYTLYIELVVKSRSGEGIFKQDFSFIKVLDHEAPYLGKLEQIKDPERPKTEESPINGIKLSKQELEELKKRPPIAVMIDNNIAARPQSGLSQADIVYEALVESSITRYMPIFWSNEVEKVGPIRSARNYYLEWLLPYDPVYLHDGCAESTDPKINACGNIYIYGIYDLATYGAWRVNDGTRFAPHNEYTSLVKAWERAKTDSAVFSKSFTPWKFKKDAALTERGTHSQIKVSFDGSGYNGGAYNVRWDYDRESNRYLRFINNQPDVDHNSGEQIWAKTVIIERARTTPTFNEKGHIIIETSGEGVAYILQDGKTIEGTWKKENRNARTKYFATDGSEVTHNRGLIWVTNIPTTNSSLDIINQ